MSPFPARLAAVLLACAAACTPGGTTDAGTAGLAPAGPTQHPWFPISAGATHAFGKDTADGPISCAQCHRPAAPSFAEVRCDGCHRHPAALTPRLHLGVRDYAPDAGLPADPDLAAEARGAGCYACHAEGSPKRPFSHAGITDRCAECHATGAAFAALPVAGFTHRDVGPTDCSACHVTASWKSTTGGPATAHDPAQDVTLDAGEPVFSQTVITSVVPLPQSLPMEMNHAAAAVPASIRDDCAACHAGAANRSFLHGLFHSSVAAAGLPQPTGCGDCHAGAAPRGFVGQLDVKRIPPSGEMRHDAVAWTTAGRGNARLVQSDCGVCHNAPAASAPHAWAVGAGGSPRAVFHLRLGAGPGLQPGSCLDCHANSRPTSTLTPANSGLPAGVSSFDHQQPALLGDCAACHASTEAWTGGRFHLPGSPPPSTCASCHEPSRPTSNAGWTDSAWQLSPFDFGGNAAGFSHGGSQDCASCHAGSTSSWEGAQFSHGAGSLAASSCSACHESQRPAVPVAGFDHARDGTGDCRGCHQASVSAGRYVDYVNPATGALPGGDWKGGQPYPGTGLVTAASQAGVLPLVALMRDSSGFVTGMAPAPASSSNGMRHTSSEVPLEVSPGPAGSPDEGSCWHCHTQSSGVVTGYAEGRFHSSLDQYSATPGGQVTPLPQPTRGCNTCHEPPPPGRISLDAEALRPLDHALTVGVDCGVCHAPPTAGAGWRTGRYHGQLPGGPSLECVSCHYPLSTESTADVSAAGRFQMLHRSPQVPVQGCGTCHADAEARAAGGGSAASSWSPGELHAHLPSQPTACVECHEIARPGSTVNWISPGYTDRPFDYVTNANGIAHGGGQECATCHAGSTASWSGGNFTHPAGALSDTTCSACHLSQRPAQAVARFDHTTRGQGDCIGCHGDTQQWKGGRFHVAAQATPAACVECHAPDRPTSTAAWVDPTWADPPFDFVSNADGGTHGAGQDCAQCHSGSTRSWTGGVFNHGAGTLAASSCAACHESQRPSAPVGAFDHALDGQGDCIKCHASTADWRGGRFHVASKPRPVSCVKCHEADRPLSEAGWKDPSFSTSPFDFGPNAAGFAHGAGQECAACHASTQAWSGGNFPHGAGTLAEQSCAACHLSQRPAAVVGGFDHAKDGTGDCVACHQATVAAGRYVDLVNPATGALPGGDWKGGQAYPGASLVTADDQLKPLSLYVLARDPQRRITGMSVTAGSLANAMRHTSGAVPAALNPGPAGAPDARSCWHCHEQQGGVVTSYARGRFHSALAGYSAAPDGPVTPLPQPTTGCVDCHVPISAAGILLDGAALRPMDHASLAGSLDCVNCHGAPGNGATWTDGRFHGGPAATASADCASCHYPLSTTAAADVQQGKDFSMKHRNADLAVQRCETCHLSAWGNAAALPPVAEAWKPGRLHASVSPQPGSCQACHEAARPASSDGWTDPNFTSRPFDYGTNHSGRPHGAGQDCSTCHAGSTQAWSGANFAHGAGTLAASTCSACHESQRPMAAVRGFEHATSGTGDCITCHASPFSWSDGRFHRPGVPTPAACVACHEGNRPASSAGWSDSTYALRPFDYGVNAAGVGHGGAQDCATCHSGSTASWAGAEFSHGPGTLASSTCAACHLTQRPVGVVGRFDHATNGDGDCLGCHASASTWAGGRFHATRPAPVACSSCHEAQRPTSASGWGDPAYSRSPFDFGANAAGFTHGAGQDCAGCHGGNTSAWSGARFAHESGSLASSTCAACHLSQRPLSPVGGFDHSLNGTGDCRGCHQATLSAGRFVDYVDPVTGALPGGTGRVGWPIPETPPSAPRARWRRCLRSTSCEVPGPGWSPG